MKQILAAAAAALALCVAGAAHAADAPPEIKIGTLYASTGAFSSISIPEYIGLNVWVEQKNAEGGVFVKPFGRKIPLKIISYDDQSSTATAATLFNQLITQDKVDVLVSDSGSVLTSVAIPIARDHKMLLIDPSAGGASFFSNDNPYIVLTSVPVSTLWPRTVADFLTKDGPALGIKRIALLYATNDFTGTQATALKEYIEASHAPVELVFDQGVATNTSNYAVLINNIHAAKPDAVIELGFPGNDIAFLRNLQDAGVKFKWLFTLYPGLEADLMRDTIGAKGLQYIFTYVPASVIGHKPEFGMTLEDFRAAFDKRNSDGKAKFGFNAVNGYTAGLVIEKALAQTESMDQLALRKAIAGISGTLKTLDGTFEIDARGAQLGEVPPVGQIVPNGPSGNKFVVVYPPELAAGKPIYPAP